MFECLDAHEAHGLQDGATYTYNERASAVRYRSVKTGMTPVEERSWAETKLALGALLGFAVIAVLCIVCFSACCIACCGERDFHAFCDCICGRRERGRGY
jgi:hypothetical protein